MLRSANASSGIRFLPALLIVGSIAVIPWLAAWFWFADLEGWPSNDDPYYAKPLALWAEHGHWQWVRQYGELTASSVAHVLTGALTTVGNHFSYRSLFLSGIFQQALAIGFLFWFARRLELPWRFAWGMAATLVCFPLYYGHAFTFMTDGPAAAWATIGCTLGMWGVVQRDWRWLVAGSLAMGWGYWIRQTNALVLLAPVLALGLGYASTARAGSRQTGQWLLSCSLILPAAIAIGAFEWGGWLPGSLARVEDVAPDFGLDYWRKAAIGAYGWLLLSGWFGLPWLVVFISQAVRARSELPPRARFACHFGAAFAALLVLGPWLATNGRACLTSATGNFIQNAHFGPIFTSDMNEPGRWGSLNGVEWPLGIWQSLSLLSLLTVVAMAWWGVWTIWQAWAAFSQRSIRRDNPETTLRQSDDLPPAANGNEDTLAFGGFACLLVFAIGIVAIVLLIEPRMDRYGLFLLPLLLVWWIFLAALGKWRLSAFSTLWAALWLAGNLTMSIVFTHDMLAWNHARWTWVNTRLDEGFEAREIDGGRDVNAWLRLDEDVNSFARPGDTSDWWSGFATFAIAVGPRPGWQIEERLPWHSWATGQMHELLVLKRAAESSPGSPQVKSERQELLP